MTATTIMAFIAQATDGGGGQTQGSGMGGMLILIVGFFAIVYFMSIRPQRRQQREHQEMISKLKAGDQVVTIGMICGEIFQVKDDSFIIKIDDQTKMEVTKGGIRSVRSKTGGESKRDEDQG